MIKSGIDRNIVVYNNESNKFSIRLVALMQTYLHNRNKREILELVYIPAQDAIDQVKISDYYIGLFGVKVVPVYDYLNKLYDELGGVFISNRTQIIIGVTNIGSVLLGMY